MIMFCADAAGGRFAIASSDLVGKKLTRVSSDH